MHQKRSLWNRLKKVTFQSADINKLSKLYVGLSSMILMIKLPSNHIDWGAAYTMFLMYPPQEKIKWREIWASKWPGYWSTPSNPGIRKPLI
jgi:hypothetical protein